MSKAVFFSNFPKSQKRKMDRIRNEPKLDLALIQVGYPDRSTNPFDQPPMFGSAGVQTVKGKECLVSMNPVNPQNHMGRVINKPAYNRTPKVQFESMKASPFRRQKYVRKGSCIQTSISSSPI